MKNSIKGKFNEACEKAFNWYTGEGSQSEVISFCEEKNLNYDFIVDFVWSHQDEYTETLKTWDELYEKYPFKTK